MLDPSAAAAAALLDESVGVMQQQGKHSCFETPALMDGSIESIELMGLRPNVDRNVDRRIPKQGPHRGPNGPGGKMIICMSIWALRVEMGRRLGTRRQNLKASRSKR